VAQYIIVAEAYASGKLFTSWQPENKERERKGIEF
jgi:hypothetical protein